ncbi:MAG: DUF2167 domain-containing protein [Chthoniobacteraceae bacterium]
MNTPLIAGFIGLLVLIMPAPAQEAPPDLAAVMTAREEAASKLNYQEGEIVLDDGLATVHVPPTLRYLDAQDTDFVITKLWGNPEGAKTLGMLVPAGASPASKDGWGVIITFENDGYVKDDDAAKIDYNDLLKTMQEGTGEANKERVKAGYPSIELVGWAATPHYDSAAKKLHWAKELGFGGDSEHTLNYNIRVLGRRGVLVLNAVAAMSQLPEIESVMPTIINAVEFNEGHRYADFDKSSDKIAAYGLTGLIAGGILAKTGLFAKLGLILAKGAKLIILAVAAIGAGISKLFRKKQSSV